MFKQKISKLTALSLLAIIVSENVYAVPVPIDLSTITENTSVTNSDIATSTGDHYISTINGSSHSFTFNNEIGKSITTTGEEGRALQFTDFGNTDLTAAQDLTINNYGLLSATQSTIYVAAPDVTKTSFNFTLSNSDTVISTSTTASADPARIGAVTVYMTDADNNYNSGNFTIDNDTTGIITSAYNDAITLFGGTSSNTAQITNDGTISSTGTTGSAIYYEGLANFTLTNTGSVTSSADSVVIANSTSSTITNESNGTISSSAGKAINAANQLNFTLTNNGTITGLGNAISVVGVADGSATITNSGTISSTNSDAINYTGGDHFTLTIREGSNITGRIYSNAYLSNTLNIEQDVSLDTFQNILSEQLVASNPTFNGNGWKRRIGTSRQIAANYSSNATYADAIEGSGSLVKTGSGRLELTEVNTYSGNTLVQAGELKVNGSIANSDTTASSGATISGTGTIKSLALESGSTLAAGNSVGTLNIINNLTLASGSNTNLEFNESAIDKIIAGGNVSLAGSANFQLAAQDGYFITSQNVIESTSGTVSGKFDNVSVNNNNYVANVTYGSNYAKATVSRKLDNNTLDAPLSSQNAIGRIVSNAVSEKLRNAHASNNKNTAAWISGGNFSVYKSSTQDSSSYSSSGYVTSVGLVSHHEDLQLIGGVFNSKTNINRYIYAGKDNMNSNGFTFGLGKNYKTDFGNIYNIAQIGAGFYNSDTTRSANVNGASQSSKANVKGNFHYLNVGSNYKIPTNLNGELNLFASATLQQTNHGGWTETGLSAGNVSVSKSSANNMNFELGTSYKDLVAKEVELPQGSFYKLEVSGYHSSLYSKKSATVTEGSASYGLTPKYQQGFTLGGGALLSIPVAEFSSITARIDGRKNNSYRETIATLGFHQGF